MDTKAMRSVVYSYAVVPNKFQRMRPVILHLLCFETAHASSYLVRHSISIDQAVSGRRGMYCELPVLSCNPAPLMRGRDENLTDGLTAFQSLILI